ncbi:MAG: SpoIIE family protein phosphatase, partial [Chloroflexi bacterium]|nr:SpoIIE family protein phosphatase [Chloroflexota bacterium]
RVFDRAVGVLNVNSDMPFRFTDEDVELAKAFSDQASVALQNARLHEREVKRLEDELKVARNIQSSLLPSVTPDVSELEIAVESLPAQQVSGDYFQFVPLPDGRIGIFVGDVSGKGMPAAMIMAVITTALRDEVIRHREPGQLLNTLNERLLERLLQNQMNCALLAAIFDPATYHLAISNAGMVQPYWRNGSQVWDFLDVGGYPLGASQRSNYSAKVIDFAPGSLMVLFSDGIIEAQDARGEFFGFERFEKLLDSMPSTITASEAVRQILHAVENHLEGIERQDDITVMVIRGVEVAKGTQHGPAMPDEIVEAMMPGALSGGVKPHALRDTYANIATAAPQRRTAPGEDGYLPPRENVELFLPSILGYEMIARSAAEALAVQMGFSDDRINDLKTAIAEACMNAIEHGNLEDRSTSVRVLLSVSANRLEARVVDRGRRPLPDPFPVPGAGNNSRGWGMFFIQNLMDEVEVQKTPDGNMIRMSLFLGKDDEFYAQIEPSPDASEWVDQNE